MQNQFSNKRTVKKLEIACSDVWVQTLDQSELNRSTDASAAFGRSTPLGIRFGAPEHGVCGGVCIETFLFWKKLGKKQTILKFLISCFPVRAIKILNSVGAFFQKLKSQSFTTAQAPCRPVGWFDQGGRRPLVGKFGEWFLRCVWYQVGLTGRFQSSGLLLIAQRPASNRPLSIIRGTLRLLAMN